MDVNARSLLNNICKPASGPGMTRTCASMLHLVREENSLENQCKMAEGGYKSYVMISVQNPTKFPKTPMNDNAKGSQN